MRSFLFGLGVVLLIAAGASVVAEIMHLTMGSRYQPVSLGSIWYAVNGNSLVGFQALVEKSISPMVWAPIQIFLTIQAWLILAPIGLILVLTCRQRNRGFSGRL